MLANNMIACLTLVSGTFSTLSAGMDDNQFEWSMEDGRDDTPPTSKSPSVSSKCSVSEETVPTARVT